MPGTASVFFDESGQERRYRPDTKYYLLTLVLRNQKDPISGLVESYERSLSESSLPNVPFHAYDLYECSALRAVFWQCADAHIVDAGYGR